MNATHDKPDQTLELEGIARDMRRLIVEMAYRSRTAHLGPALGIVDILTVLYFRILNINPAAPQDPVRDRFILSKGHAAAALYAALACKGFFPSEELARYCVDGGRFHGHPCTHAGPGIEFSTGSLGHGLSVAAGTAYGLRKRGMNNRIVTLLGDGECNEGSVWEAAMFGTTHELSNLTAVIDANRFQGFGATQDVHHANLVRMWGGFGWEVIVCDGHELQDIEDALRVAIGDGRPSVVIARTISGKGVNAIEDTLRAHYEVLDDVGYARAMEDLYAK